MKKILVACVAAVGLLSGTAERASAWCSFNFGAGFNVGFECGRNGCGNQCGNKCAPACDPCAPMMAPATLEAMPHAQANTQPGSYVIEFVPQFAQPSAPAYNTVQQQQQNPSRFQSLLPRNQSRNVQPNNIQYVPVYITPGQQPVQQPSTPAVAQPVQQSNYQYGDGDYQGVAPAYWYDR